jgi:hypothetical protein
MQNTKRWELDKLKIEMKMKVRNCSPWPKALSHGRKKPNKKQEEMAPKTVGWQEKGWQKLG